MRTIVGVVGVGAVLAAGCGSATMDPPPPINFCATAAARGPIVQTLDWTNWKMDAGTCDTRPLTVTVLINADGAVSIEGVGNQGACHIMSCVGPEDENQLPINCTSGAGGNVWIGTSLDASADAIGCLYLVNGCGYGSCL